MNPHYTIESFSRTRTIVPLIARGIGSLPCLWLTYLNYFLEVIFAELAEKKPIALIGHDSAGNTKNNRVALPGCDSRPAPPGLIATYVPHSVQQLRDRCAAVRGTQPLADQLGRIPAASTSLHGCSQLAPFGKALYLANLQEIRETWHSAVLTPREAERIAACRNQGLRVIQTDEIHVVRVVTAGGSTGESVDALDAMLSKAIAKEKGIKLKNHLIAVLPSCCSSVTEDAMRANAGKFVLEAALAVRHPEKIVLHTLDGKAIRYTDGPIYDSIVPFGVTSAFQAASSRDEIAARLAILALTFVTTPFLPWSDEAFADALKSQRDGRYGAAIFRRIGWARTFLSRSLNEEVMFKAAHNHARQLL